MKSYEEVRMKPWDEIEIMTEEAERVKEKIKKEGMPIPLYSRILSDEELKSRGLYSIGRD